MSDDLSLFGDDDPGLPEPTAAPSQRAPAPVSDWQIDLIRKALDARGLAEMAARQERVEQVVGRALASLRDLSSEEALAVLSGLGAEPARSPSGEGSAWDQREGDTWIDRL